MNTYLYICASLRFTTGGRSSFPTHQHVRHAAVQQFFRFLLAITLLKSLALCQPISCLRTSRKLHSGANNIILKLRILKTLVVRQFKGITLGQRFPYQRRFHITVTMRVKHKILYARIIVCKMLTTKAISQEGS